VLPAKMNLLKHTLLCQT